MEKKKKKKFFFFGCSLAPKDACQSLTISSQQVTSGDIVFSIMQHNECYFPLGNMLGPFNYTFMELCVIRTHNRRVCIVVLYPSNLALNLCLVFLIAVLLNTYLSAQPTNHSVINIHYHCNRN